MIEVQQFLGSLAAAFPEMRPAFTLTAEQPSRLLIGLCDKPGDAKPRFYNFALDDANIARPHAELLAEIVKHVCDARAVASDGHPGPPRAPSSSELMSACRDETERCLCGDGTADPDPAVAARLATMSREELCLALRGALEDIADCAEGRRMPRDVDMLEGWLERAKEDAAKLADLRARVDGPPTETPTP